MQNLDSNNIKCYFFFKEITSSIIELFLEFRLALLSHIIQSQIYKVERFEMHIVIFVATSGWKY